MSYDLMVFDAGKAPLDRDQFMDWFDQRMESEDDSEGDPAICSPELRAWFMDMIQRYPPLNGIYAAPWDGEDATSSDYALYPDMIYICFAWSQAEQAFEDTFALAAKHGVGFFNVSSGTSAVWIPDGQGGLKLLHEESD